MMGMCMADARGWAGWSPADSCYPTDMAPPSLLIVDARLVGEDGVEDGDLLVRDGRIERRGGDLRSEAVDRVIEADGRHLLPGLIDGHVHFREPGLIDKGDVAGESAAALAGGVTSCLDMPNTRPPTTDAKRLAAKRELIGRSAVNLGFFLGSTATNLEELLTADPTMVPGVKLFLGSSTGDLAVHDPVVLEAIFSRLSLPLAVHAEDDGIIQENAAAIRAARGRQPPASVHAAIRSREACLTATGLALELAARYDTDLHLCHLSTADELALFDPGAVAEKRRTAEACLPHLALAEEDYARLGNRMKCNPSVKDILDRNALRAGLRDCRIDLVATDHAPHPAVAKDGAYFKAASGVPGVQFLLPFLLDLVAADELTLPDLVRLACHNPARRFGIAQRGFLREGAWADLVLVDTDLVTAVTDESVVSACAWSPYAGREFRGGVVAVVVSGVLAWVDGRPTGVTGARLLDFDHRRGS